MNLELRSIKLYPGRSQETECFTARLYLDGKAFAVVENEGTGGPDRLLPVKGAANDSAFWVQIKAINAHLKDTFPPTVAYGMKLDYDLELWTADRIGEEVARRALKRRLKSRVLFTRPDKAGIWEVLIAGTDADTIARVQKHHPGAVILNTLPDAEAVALYRGPGL